MKNVKKKIVIIFSLLVRRTLADVLVCMCTGASVQKQCSSLNDVPLSSGPNHTLHKILQSQ